MWWVLNKINNLVVPQDSEEQKAKSMDALRGAAKGLCNNPGENNCFLNSAVQVLWQLDVFRNSFRDLEGHLCLQNSCIFCALKVLFTQYEYNEMFTLPPNILRNALAEYFSNENRFCLGEMDDAAEAFENILKRIHFHLCSHGRHTDDPATFCNTEFCVTHKLFSMNITEKLKCEGCGISRVCQIYSQLSYYINANTLIDVTRECQKDKATSFGNMLKLSSKTNSLYTCQSANNCGKRARLHQSLDNCPDVVTIGISWQTNTIEQYLIKNFLNTIQESFEIQDLFDSVECLSDAYDKGDYRLKALICYYGRHYTAFCFSNKLNEWLYLNDTTVCTIGPLWDMVLDKCVTSHFQPYLLFYCARKPGVLNTARAPIQTKVLDKI